MPETGTSGSMSGDGKRDDTFVSTRAHPRLYPNLVPLGEKVRASALTKAPKETTGMLVLGAIDEL